MTAPPAALRSADLMRSAYEASHASPCCAARYPYGDPSVSCCVPADRASGTELATPYDGCRSGDHSDQLAACLSELPQKRNGPVRCAVLTAVCSSCAGAALVARRIRLLQSRGRPRQATATARGRHWRGTREPGTRNSMRRRRRSRPSASSRSQPHPSQTPVGWSSLLARPAWGWAGGTGSGVRSGGR